MKCILSIACFLLLIRTVIFSEIYEIDHFEEIIHYIKPNSLIILDIDDTLLVPVQTLGTDVWFQYQVNKYQQQKHPDAFEKALSDWEGIRHFTKMKLVEPGINRIVNNMQSHGLKIIGLTTQGLALATRTVQHLKSFEIDLAKTAVSQKEHFFINQHGVLFRQGILFTSGTRKGEALLKLLAIVNYIPEHVIFINDKERHLQDVEHTLEKSGIPFVGLRYAYCDERIKKFDPQIAEIQWAKSTFGNILSDDDAELFLGSSTTTPTH